MEVIFLHITPLHIGASAIRECYDSHDKSDTKIVIPHYAQEGEAVCGPRDKELIYKVGNVYKHSSTLEHIVFNVRIRGVSRLLLQEAMRHRLSSPSVKSTRFTLSKDLKNEEEFIIT